MKKPTGRYTLKAEEVREALASLNAQYGSGDIVSVGPAHFTVQRQYGTHRYAYSVDANKVRAFRHTIAVPWYPIKTNPAKRPRAPTLADMRRAYGNPAKRKGTIGVTIKKSGNAKQRRASRRTIQAVKQKTTPGYIVIDPQSGQWIAKFLYRTKAIEYATALAKQHKRQFGLRSP